MQALRKYRMTPLFGIKGGLKVNETTSVSRIDDVFFTPRVQCMADAAYAIAVTALWNGEVLSAASQQRLKEFIRSFLLQHTDREQCYTAFVERVLLARAYVESVDGRYIPSPEWWVDTTNDKGFKGTARWYKKLIAVRETYPLREQVMKVIAEAVLDMRESPTAKNFHYWRGYFIKRGWEKGMNLFLAVVGMMDHHSR